MNAALALPCVSLCAMLTGCAHQRFGEDDLPEYPKIVSMFCLLASCARAYSVEREPDVLYIRCIASVCNVVRKETPPEPQPLDALSPGDEPPMKRPQ